MIFSTPSSTARLVEGADQPVEVGDQAHRREPGGDPGETHDVGEQHGDRLDPVGDGALAAAEPRDHRGGQDVGEERLGAALLGVELGQIVQFALVQALALERGGDAGAQDRRVERLADEVLGTGGEALAGHLGMVDAGEDQDRQLRQRWPPAQGEQDLEAVHGGHQEVEQDQIGRLALEPGEGGGAGFGQRHLVAGEREDVLQEESVVLEIVDDQDRGRGCRRLAGQAVGGRGQGGGELGRTLVGLGAGRRARRRRRKISATCWSMRVEVLARQRRAVLQQQLGEALDRAQRRAQVVAQAAQQRPGRRRPHSARRRPRPAAR